MTEALVLASIVLVEWTVFLLARQVGQEKGLVAYKIINLILISVLGSKLITIFGFTTNAGNIFYASVFLAIFYYLETYGVKRIYNDILIVYFALVLFNLLATLTLLYPAINTDVQKTLSTLFLQNQVLQIASLGAFLIASNVGIAIFILLSKMYNGSYFWARLITAQTIAQFFDSIIFFSIAFSRTYNDKLLEIFITGFTVKIIYTVLSLPVLYMSLKEGAIYEKKLHEVKEVK